MVNLRMGYLWWLKSNIHTFQSVEILNCPMPKVLNPKNEKKDKPRLFFAWVDRLIVGFALSFDNIVIYSNLECKTSILMVVKLPMLIGSATNGAHDAPTMTINNDYSQSTPYVRMGIESTLHKTLQRLWCRSSCSSCRWQCSMFWRTPNSPHSAQLPSRSSC